MADDVQPVPYQPPKAAKRIVADCPIPECQWQATLGANLDEDHRRHWEDVHAGGQKAWRYPTLLDFKFTEPVEYGQDLVNDEGDLAGRVTRLHAGAGGTVATVETFRVIRWPYRL